MQIDDTHLSDFSNSIIINSTYLKDLSFENPKSPATLLYTIYPSISLDININTNKIKNDLDNVNFDNDVIKKDIKNVVKNNNDDNDGIYEVVLKVTIVATVPKLDQAQNGNSNNDFTYIDKYNDPNLNLEQSSQKSQQSQQLQQSSQQSKEIIFLIEMEYGGLFTLHFKKNNQLNQLNNQLNQLKAQDIDGKEINSNDNSNDNSNYTQLDTTKELNRILFVHCPNILFPYVMRIAHDMSISGGYQQLNIGPVDFLGLYLQNQQITGK